MNIVKSQEISWLTILNFVDLKGKKVFLLCKKILKNIDICEQSSNDNWAIRKDLNNSKLKV